MGGLANDGLDVVPFVLIPLGTLLSTRRGGTNGRRTLPPYEEVIVVESRGDHVYKVCDEAFATRIDSTVNDYPHVIHDA